MQRLVVSLLVLSGLGVLGTAGPSAARESHPLNPRDLLDLDRITDPQVSPDGRSLVFVRRSTDFDADRGRTDLWQVGIDGSGLRRLTTHPAGDSNPRWAPDASSLFFRSSRSGSSQVWRLPLHGGEASQVTDFPLDVGNLVLSPDGETLAFTVEVFPDCETLQCSADRLEVRGEEKANGRVYDDLFIRHWDTWKDGRRSQLFAWPRAGAEDREPVALSRHLDADVPSKPFGGPEEITFTPDGSGLVFAARVAGKEEPWSTNFDLYYVPVDGSKPPRNLTGKNPAWDTHPVFSPDGKTLAYLAMERPGYESDRFRLVVRHGLDGEDSVLTQDWDRSVREFVFSRDSQTIYATAPDLGQVSLTALDLAGGGVRKLVEEGTARSPVAVASGVAFRWERLGVPSELHVVSPRGGPPAAVTRLNADTLASIRVGEVEQFTFPGWNGETVYAYLVKPVDFEPGRKYPLAFLIHGGPQGSFGNSFHYRWNAQVFAGAGYAVVMVDFHGSVGYGQAFTDSIRDDWGGKPLEDLKKGLAAAVERYPFLDRDRACALGASYGGYMVNWIAGNWPDGFRCLVNHDGLFDNRMMYYTTEELWFPEWDHMGTYFENPEAHERHNPVRYVDRWQTPMLVIHGARDYRVPDTQGLATFTALRRRGVAARLLYFPEENHWVLKPHNSLQWHEEVLGWLERWLGK